MSQFQDEMTPPRVSRRRVLQAMAAVGAAGMLRGVAPAYAAPPAQGAAPAVPATSDGVVELEIRKTRLLIGGRAAMVTTVNGSLPGPLLRFREGETATVRITNRLDEDTSIHWHGLLVPPAMDGVPGLSFAGIKPGETFTYRFPLRQSGTYWYHSHSAMQEPEGVYGPLIIEPASAESYGYDRDYVVMLSDWSFEDAARILAKLKKDSAYYNFNKRTLADVFRDASKVGWRAALADHAAWAQMRMDPTDIADVTGATYTYLVNGLAPADNWTAIFTPGQRIRLRLINGSAMTYFDLRIPGLRLTVVQADGQDVEPVVVDELRIAAAETYDVIVQPEQDRAYTLFAESMDRSGYARGTLATRQGMSAPVPERRPRPLRRLADMGPAHGGHRGETTAMAGHASQGPRAASGHAAPDFELAAAHMHHPRTESAMQDVAHDHHAPARGAHSAAENHRLNEPGIGLGNDGWRVLVYADLRSLAVSPDPRPPAREIELRLTGNMERYTWSFDGKRYAEAREPIPFTYGERLRVSLVNDTMMEHPIHLHGMWMELDNGAGAHKPRKHTLSVKPGERVSVEITADAPGAWAFHCHLFYHMAVGMFRVVSVTQPGAAS